MKNRLLTALPLILFGFFTTTALRAQNTAAQIIGPSVLCQGTCDTFRVLVTGSVTPPAGYLYKWSITGPGGYSAFANTPFFYFCPSTASGAPLPVGTYLLTVSVSTPNGITYGAEHPITVVPFIPLKIKSGNTAPCNSVDSTDVNNLCEKTCPKSSIVYTVNTSGSQGGTSQPYISWTVTGASSFFYNDPPFNTSITVNWGGPGTGTISVSKNGPTGTNCYGTDHICVTIIPEPVAKFSTNPALPASGPLQICKGQTVYFTNNSNGGDTFEWRFGDASAPSAETNPQHTYLNAGTYAVTLITRSNCLCADTTSINVEVLDATSPSLDCVGTICPGTTVTYTASNGCSPFTWTVSPNGTVLNGGTAGTDSVTVHWNAGPSGTITLSAQPCSGNTCPRPAVMEIPIISDDAQIAGPDRVCPLSEEVYAIEPYTGTNFVWTLSGGGTIKSGQGTNRVTISWGPTPNPGQPYWLSVKYDNCYLGCGGQDSLAVMLLSPFVINGPVELCDHSTGNFTTKLTGNNQLVVSNWTLIAPDGSTAWTSAVGNASMTIPFNKGGGTYRLIATPVTANNSCSDQATWVIFVSGLPPKPTSIAGPANICPNTVSTYEAKGIFGDNNVVWTIQNGAGAPVTYTGNPINVTWGNTGPRWLAAAQILFTGMNCTSDTTRLDINQISALSIAGDTVVCEGGLGAYTIQSVKNLSFQWQVNPPSAGAIASGQGTNAVSIFWGQPGGHVVNVSVCGQSATVPVTVVANPTPVVQYSAAICPGKLSAVQTATPYNTYQWTDATGAILSTIANPTLPVGSYAVQVTDVAGCKGTAEFSVNQSPNPNLTISTASPTGFCNNATTVTLTALTNAGMSFTYQWFQNGNPVGTNATSYSTNQYGTYTVQATNQFGCSVVSSPIVLYNYCGGGGGGGGFPGGGGADCPPGSASFTTTATGACDSFQFNMVPNPLYVPASANWFFIQASSGLFSNVTGDQVNLKFPNAGQFVALVTVHLVDGSVCKLVDSVRINAAAQFNVTPACPGLSSAFEDVSTLLPPATFTSWQWDFGDPASGAANTSTGANTGHTYVTGGNYQATLTVTANSGCTASATLPVSIRSATPLTLVPPAAHCSGDALSFTATGGPDLTDISWDFGNPASGAANTAGGTPAFHNYSTTGVYTVTATSTNVYGCTGSYTESITVSPNPLSGNITPSAPAPVCEGKSITLTAPGGAVLYLWSDSTTTTQTITVAKEGSYSVTMTDANGCTYVPPAVTVKITQAPDVLIKAIIENELGQVIGTTYPNLSVCAGENVHLIASAIGNYGYQWSGGNGISNEIFFSDSRNNLLSVGNYLYTVTVTDFISGCTAVSDPFIVDVNPVPSGFSISAGGICAHNGSMLTYAGPTPANWLFIWNTGQTGTTLTADAPGNYYIRVINEFGCEAQSNPVAILPGPPVASIPAGCHTRCSPDTLCLPPLQGIVTWQWYFNGNPVPGATSPLFVAQQSGTYWASLTDVFGCPGQSDPLTLKLLTGYGNITGKVWSDVNNNGVIDAGDTLVSGISVVLHQGGTTKGTTQSGTTGGFAFTNVLSTNYSVDIDPAALPPNWTIVVGQSPATLNGCNAQDSTNLLLHYACQVTSALSLSACPGDAAPYGGTFIAAGTSQVFHYNTAAGCDSAVTVTVKKLGASTGTLAVKVCPNAVYTYNNIPVLPGQPAQFVLQNYQGCDSILTVTVTALATSSSTLNVAVCPGSMYDYYGTQLSVGQTAKFTLQNYLGCDSTVTVNVGALASTAGSVQANVCPGEAFTYSGTQLHAGDTATFTLQNAAGCDSVVTVTVGALLATTGSVQASVCPGQTFAYAGSLLQPGDTATFILPNAAGCDSTVTVTVLPLQASATALQAGVCPGTTYTYNGAVLNSGDVRQFIFPNAVGCDSVVTLTIFDFAVSADSLTFTACPGDHYDFNGTSILTGTSQVFHYSNYEGCDSTLIVKVIPWPDAVFSLEPSLSCPGKPTGSLTVSTAAGGTPPFQYSLDGVQYQADPVFDTLAAGNYTVRLKDANGCVFSRDTIIGKVPPLQVALANGMLPCDSSGVRMAPLINDTLTGPTYLWSTGDSSSFITVKGPGPVWVEVTNACEKVHKEAQVAWVTLDGDVPLVYVPNVMAPEARNPLNALFRPLFAAGIAVESYKFEVFDRWGNLMFSTTDQQASWNGFFKSKEMQPGVYVWYMVAKISFCGQAFDLKKFGDVTVVR